MTRDARLPALHRGDFGLRSRASFSGIYSGSVQRAPRSQVVVPGGRGPVPPETTVMTRRRGTPRLAPPSGSSPEMPLNGARPGNGLARPQVVVKAKVQRVSNPMSGL